MVLASLPSGLYVKRRFWLPCRYRRTHFVACRWIGEGSDTNCDSCWTAKAILGLVQSIAYISEPMIDWYSGWMSKSRFAEFISILINFVPVAKGVETAFESSMPNLARISLIYVAWSIEMSPSVLVTCMPR